MPIYKSKADRQYHCQKAMTKRKKEKQKRKTKEKEKPIHIQLT